jgi:hypothetical protein
LFEHRPGDGHNPEVLEHLMKQPPSRAPDLLLGAEAYYNRFYAKQPSELSITGLVGAA